VVAFDKKDKTCSANAAALETFNKFKMNKQQNIKIGNFIDYGDKNVQKSIGKDAV